MKKPVDHKKHIGGIYQPRPTPSEELRQVLAERMREFNRRTGKLTALQNRRLKRSRLAKP